MTLSEICEKLKTNKSVLVFCHTRPDGDAIGSALALKDALISLGIDADVACDSDIPEKFSFLSGTETFLKIIDKQYDAFVGVDCSDEQRMGALCEKFRSNKNTFNIDHHISNTRYAKYNYVDDIASTSEIICELCECLKAEITAHTANCLMLGICTDTGNFAHKNVTEGTFLVAAKLMRRGADLNKINTCMFKNQTKERAFLYADVMSGLKLYCDGKLGIIVVTLEMLAKHNATPDFTEGFIDFPLSVNSVEVAVCMLQVKPKQFKLSFRSKGKVDVNEVASLYGGGGHILASGCMINDYYEDILDKITYDIKVRL